MRNLYRRYAADAIPGACGFQVTTGDSCPTALFTPVLDPEDESVVTAVSVTTADKSVDGFAAPTLVIIDAKVYAPKVGGSLYKLNSVDP
jgi:hypothetical protein